MVRIIENTDTQSVDRIIKATNSQTTIPAAWLHATEEIHRKIESVLSTVGLYYDRRKNYYRNRGISASKIVTIPYLSQALVAIVLQRPDDARARPTTVAEKVYDQLFSETFPVEAYSKCALILKRVDEFLDGLTIDRGDRLNTLFYIAMYATSAALKSPRPKTESIAAMNIATITDDSLSDCYNRVLAEYLKLGGDDKTAKGPALVDVLKNALRSRFGRGKKP